MVEREFDILLWGVTGWTGVHLLEYFVQNYPLDEATPNLKWAIVARNNEKLEMIVEQTASSLNAGWLDDVPRILCSNDDEEKIMAAVARTKVVATVVGPYSKYGEILLKSCVEQKTHYCDITGETPWIKEMIAKYQDAAKENEVFLVPFSGVDSVPSDLSVFLGIQASNKTYKKEMNISEEEFSMVKKTFNIKGYVTKSVMNNRHEGSESSPGGGTFSSFMEMVDQGKFKDGLNPYILTGEDDNCKKDSSHRPQTHVGRDSRVKGLPWTTAGIMAMINEPVVRRSRYLLPSIYGSNFSYHEAQSVKNPFQALAFSMGFTLGPLLVQNSFIRNRFIKRILPKTSQTPPKKPNQEKYKNGSFEMMILIDAFYEVHGASTKASSRVNWKMADEPAYTETSKMLSEVAIMLAKENKAIRENTGATGGFITSACLGNGLAERLQAKGAIMEVERL